ncbi:hypothetical protein [Flavobacterium sp.]|uniref:hypothetical protein n=1 Tax=Flavobacterium sp. TaxID=239 RepID=UPI00286AD534|nr:hypothetical protein [Flavobacterium sp.]
MKKIFFAPIFTLLFFAFSSCETQDSLDPRPLIVDGQYVRLDITKKVLTSDHLDTAVFGGALTTPGNNVQSYDLYVRRHNVNDVITGNYVKLLTITSFPTELAITPQMIADALSIPRSDLLAGDVFTFLGYSKGFDGTIVDYNKLSATVKAQAGMKQGYKFMTKLASDTSINNEQLNLYFNNYQLGL